MAKLLEQLTKRAQNEVNEALRVLVSACNGIAAIYQIKHQVSICLSVCLPIVCVCMHTCACTCLHVCMCVYMCMYICAYVCVCIVCVTCVHGLSACVTLIMELFTYPLRSGKMQ